MGRTASASISEILKVEAPSKVDEMFNVEVDGLEVFFTPHPIYIYRFRWDLAAKMRSLLTGKQFYA